MGARNILKESAKDVAFRRSRKFTPRVSLRKQRPSLSHAVRMAQCKQCLWFPTRMWDATGHTPANLWRWAGATGMEFFQHEQDNEGWNDKWPLWARTPDDKVPWQLAPSNEGNAAYCTHSLLGRLTDAWQYMHLLVSRAQREYSHCHKVKLPGHRTGQEETTSISGRKGTNRKHGHS